MSMFECNMYLPRFSISCPSTQQFAIFKQFYNKQLCTVGVNNASGKVVDDILLQTVFTALL